MTAHDERLDHVIAVLAPIAERKAALAPLTTYRVGGSAAVLVKPRDRDDLEHLADVVAATGLPVLVVGRGSNLLVADTGFPGIAISLAELAATHRIEGDQVVAGAAVALPQLARQVVATGLAGFEWAVGVPGSVGGAVRMNAGGHGGDIATCLVDVDLFDIRLARGGRVDVSRLGLHFRGSELAAHQIVLDARIQLRAGDRLASEQELNEIVRWRREHQPGGQNAGSVFVNPIPGELSAGELIDRCGLRGFVLGSASVSSKHANFIQGSDGGSAADVVALIEHVRRRVADETGFLLRSEVRLIGFANDAGEVLAVADDGPGIAL